MKLKLPRVTEERTRELLTHCKNSNFNTTRVWGGGYYPDDYFFDIFDKLGIIVFLDLMFACALYDFDEKMMGEICEEVRQNISRVAHHACLGVVCGNNENEMLESGRNLIFVRCFIFGTSHPRLAALFFPLMSRGLLLRGLFFLKNFKIITKGLAFEGFLCNNRERK